MAPLRGDDGTGQTSGIPPRISGVLGDSARSIGVLGTSAGEAGVLGINSIGPGVVGNGLEGVRGVGRTIGVLGQGDIGLHGTGDTIGIFAQSLPAFGNTGTALLAESAFIAVHAHNFGIPGGNDARLATRQFAGEFLGPVSTLGTLVSSGGGFTIDHPLDPSNRYLHHSFMESPERKNVYDGIALLGGDGTAVVELPEWFSALNRDYRYQLTCVGEYSPVFVAQEIEGSCFRIAGGSPGLKVSWQVTGIRQDAWANANPIQPEQEKTEAERGCFLYPALHGQPEELSVHRARYPQDPKLREKLEELRRTLPSSGDDSAP